MVHHLVCVCVCVCVCEREREREREFVYECIREKGGHLPHLSLSLLSVLDIVLYVCH